MTVRTHRYTVALDWTGNRGGGTPGYTGYDRDHELRAAGKSAIAGSSDPAFRGDRTRWNPEELLVGALSACHQLWYLHLCAEAGIRVTAYTDSATGVMEEETGGAGHFVSATLHPHVVIAHGDDPHRALSLHAEAARLCYIARSVAFPVDHRPTIAVEEPATAVSTT
jgi:organic hydroperoxide reductase OsmC/OhrA